MAGQRQPIELVVEKGRKHLTKAEIAERQKTEVKAPADKVTAPQYLNDLQKKAFKKIVKELQQVGIVANLDVDALARLVIAQSQYLRITAELERLPLMVEIDFDTGKKDEDGNKVYKKVEVVNTQVERLTNLQDKYFRQCRQGAADFGMTVSSRCRLVVQNAPDEPQKGNKFMERFA